MPQLRLRPQFNNQGASPPESDWGDNSFKALTYIPRKTFPTTEEKIASYVRVEEIENSILSDEYDQLSSETMVAAFVQGLQQTFSSDSNSSPLLALKSSNDSTTSFTTLKEERPIKQLKVNTQTSTLLDHKTTEPLILSFNSPDFSNNPQQYYKDDHSAGYSGDLYSMSPVYKYSKVSALANQELDEIVFEKYLSNKSTSTAAPATQLRDHVIAERKRRENLSQLFVAVSTMVPGLKKTDKSSVLGETIKYIKQLKEKTEKLEAQINKKDIESVVVIKRSKMVGNEDQNEDFFEEISAESKEELLPKIEAKVLENNVLLRIHCLQKQKGVLAKALSEMEKMNLRVINISTLPFGDFSLDITIIAQMDKDSCAALMKGVVRSLRDQLFNSVREKSSALKARFEIRNSSI
ncbi:hypothetical protein FNV43_RR17411 [Rhamnella rubrinervis]|uniref:BHLH domain-containing protein n=1 Tax=Rhamnella rubrinervis TaxID=2594499 RepID=A0A8K0GVD9_9ROSA|nr:hypothetical protein FNV43_RR17411 [Rhamnella rubrinervis]